MSSDPSQGQPPEDGEETVVRGQHFLVAPRYCQNNEFNNKLNIKLNILLSGDI